MAFIPKFEKLSLKNNGRIIAISDVHAHGSWLKRLLEKIDFSDIDELFLLGDYIERGIENLSTLKYIFELDKKNNVHVIMGNHEIWRLWALTENSAEDLKKHIDNRLNQKRTSLLIDMAEKMSLPLDTIEDIDIARKKALEKYEYLFEYIRNLPSVIETDKYIFVHAGIPDTDPEKWKKYPQGKFTKFDNFMNDGPHFDKWVICGHWPVLLYDDSKTSMNPIVDKNKKIISIDGGCGVKKCGRLNAFIIDSNDVFSFDSVDNLLVAKALENQNYKKADLKISWNLREIDILSKQDDLALVKVKKNNATAKIPINFLYKENGNDCCEDYIDTSLQIKKGDKLKIIKQCKSGLYCILNGEVGWYYGKYDIYN